MGFKLMTYMGEMCGEYTAINICHFLEISLKWDVRILYIQSNSRLSRYSLTEESKASVNSKIKLVGD